MNNSIAQNKESQDSISPDDALNILMEGNQRFINNEPLQRNNTDSINSTSEGQWPFATVLACIDSRVPVETVFDQGIGDIFTARVAGNFVNTDILGSIEYATKVAGSKLIMILGHTGCGAVKSACLRVQLGNITDLLSNILPAVDAVEKDMENDPANPDFTNRVAETNVHMAINNMLEQSPIIKQLQETGAVKIVGAMYDIASGKVSLLD
jgi:carbonic anhydrase